jgi:inosose dehydratase
MTNRRRFLQCVGVGAAISLATSRNVLAQAPAASPAETKPSGRPTLPFELGLASYSLRKLPLEQMLTVAARVGLKYVCMKDMHLKWDAKPETIAQALELAKKAGVTVYGSGVVYMSKPENVVQAFEYAKALGAKVIVCAPAVELLPLVNEHVQKYDLRVAIHNHGPNDKRYPRPADAYDAVKGMDQRMGLCIDIGHTVRIGDDLCRVTEQFADRLHDVHFKDESAAAPEGRPVEAGRGVIDIPAFLRTLVKIGYSGKLSFEYEKDADDPVPGLAESVGYVRGVLAAI